MQKIIILNFVTTEVHVFPYDENIWRDAEEFINSKDFKDFDFSTTNCHWMVVDELNIQIH